ncbi:MAG: hypothetical protein WCD04_03555 [Terriglobia bacterium]
MSSLREEFEKLRSQKHLQFDDFDRIIRRIVNAHPELFPRFTTKSKGARVVYHFNVRNLWPISLEREHKGRDHVPTSFARLALGGIEDLLIYVEGEHEGS